MRAAEVGPLFARDLPEDRWRLVLLLRCPRSRRVCQSPGTRDLGFEWSDPKFPNSSRAAYVFHQIDHRRPCQPLEVIEGHADGIGMAARIEFDGFVMLQLSIAVGRHPKQIAERR